MGRGLIRIGTDTFGVFSANKARILRFYVGPQVGGIPDIPLAILEAKLSATTISFKNMGLLRLPENCSPPSVLLPI